MKKPHILCALCAVAAITPELRMRGNDDNRFAAPTPPGGRQEDPPESLLTGKDPGNRALFAGRKAEAALRAYLREHPRWGEEDSGPVRVRRLCDQAVDAYLRVVWTGKADPETSAQALWLARRCALLIGETARAHNFAEDLLRAHSNTPYAKDIASLRETHSLPSSTAGRPPAAPGSSPALETPPVSKVPAAGNVPSDAAFHHSGREPVRGGRLPR